jgi:hypothetical protein
MTWLIVGGVVFVLWPLVRLALTSYTRRDHDRAYLRFHERGA